MDIEQKSLDDLINVTLQSITLDKIKKSEVYLYLLITSSLLMYWLTYLVGVLTFLSLKQLQHTERPTVISQWFALVNCYHGNSILWA